MKTMIFAGALLAGTTMAAPAMAQDAAASPFAGPYVGVQAGIGQLDELHDDKDYWYDAISNGLQDDRSVRLGLRAGYDAQLGNALVGALVEGSIGRMNAYGASHYDYDAYDIGTRVNKLGSIRAKAGLTSGSLAAFVTGGLAFSDAKHKLREDDGDGSYDSHADRSGYVLGMGGAFAIGGNSNIGLEYSRYDFGSRTNELDGDYRFAQDYKVRSLMLSYNYGFGARAAAASVAGNPAFGGPYVGVQGTFGQLDNDYSDIDYWYGDTAKSRNSDRGAMIGLRAGYDLVRGNLLAGALVEASIGKMDTFAENSGDDTYEQYKIGTRLTHLGSVRGKLGVTSGNLAFFATGGLAFSNAKHRFDETDGSNEFYRAKADRTGYVLGLGTAWAIGNSTVGLDYSHYEFGNRTSDILEDDGESTDYRIGQDYKVRALTLSFNYGF